MAYRNREEDKLERREEQAKRQEQSGAASGGERPRRSWKEIDARREGARGRSGGDDRGPPRQKGESAGYRNYKSKLDKLFDGQLKLDAPVQIEVVRSQQAAPPAPAPMPVATKTLTPRERLKAAQSDADVAEAAQAALAEGGLPLDAELLLKVLSQPSSELYLAALEALLDTLEKGRPKNAKLVLARLDVMLPALSGETADIAKGLRARLGG